MERLSVEQIRRSAKRFKAATGQVDGLHPRHFGHLTDARLSTSAVLWDIVQIVGDFPPAQSSQPTRLIPKASPGLRPIMLFRSQYRQWAASYSGDVAAWSKQLCRLRPYINMASGR